MFTSIGRWVTVALTAGAFTASAIPAGATRERPEGPARPSPQSYALNLTWNASTHKLTGSESVTFTNDRSSNMSTAYFRLWPNSSEYAASCSKRFITVSDVTGGTAGALQGTCTVLPVTLPKPLAPGKSATISLSFVDTVPKNHQRFGYDGDYVNLATAFPILAVTDDRGTHLETPPLLGEGQYSLTSSFDVTLSIPAGMEAATTGTVTAASVNPGGRETLVISAPQSRDFEMAIGPYTVYTTTVDGVLLRYFERPGTKVPASTVLNDWAAGSFASYTAHYGPWYGTELDIAGEPNTFLDQGMEYPELIMTELVQSTVTHEVGHMWFYAMVGNSQYVEPWLDETLTEFSSDRYLGTNLSCNVTDPFGNSKYALDDSMATYDPLGNKYFTIIYYYGPCAIERLRRDWGNALFDQMMQDYLSTYRLGVATTSEWKAKVRKYAPAGYDVDAYFSFAHLTTWPG
jgi:hypothetical protein